MRIERTLGVGTLAAGVGHEINNPLAYVMANLTYATDEVRRVQQQLETSTDRFPSASTLAKTLSEVVDILGEVEDGACRIRDIARDLNTFARNDEEQGLVDLRRPPTPRCRLHEIRRRVASSGLPGSPSRTSERFETQPGFSESHHQRGALNRAGASD
jgi:signal transduction histidine kinase